MIPQYDDSYLDENRNVMNTGEPPVDFVVSTNYDKRAEKRSSRYDSIEFTSSSANFEEPLEDEELLSGSVKPRVTGYYDTGYDGQPNIYNPDKDNSLLMKSEGKKAADLGKMPKEAYGVPDFFNNTTDLIIASVICGAIVILEIIGLIALF